MASKQNIKEAINLLCKIINQHGGSKLMPETFRLAKFNKDEATEAMWKLLFETNRFLNCGSFQCFEDLTKGSNQDMVLCIKHDLFIKGYYVKDFFMLPEDMSCGSREILLAFGWLMSRAKLVRVLLGNCSNLLEECLPFNEDSFTCINPIASKKYVNNYNFSSIPQPDEMLNLNQLSWVLGHLQLTCNGLYAAENHLISLVNKVHCATLGAENPKGHLSALEVFFLRHPKELAKFQEKLDRHNSDLVNLLKFIDLQDVFWKWMESVYEAKVTECKDKKVEEFRRSVNQCCKTCQENTDQSRKEIYRIQFKIQKMLDDGNIPYLNACEILQINKPCEKQSKRVLSELNQQMASLSVKESPSTCRNKPQTFPELKQLSTNSSIAGNVKNCESSCAQQEIKMLNRKISELELELLETRNSHFEILNDLTANLQEFVCIPPIGTSKYVELKNK